MSKTRNDYYLFFEEKTNIVCERLSKCMAVAYGFPIGYVGERTFSFTDAVHSEKASGVAVCMSYKNGTIVIIDSVYLAINDGCRALLQCIENTYGMNGKCLSYASIKDDMSKQNENAFAVAVNVPKNVTKAIADTPVVSKSESSENKTTDNSDRNLKSWL